MLKVGLTGGMASGKTFVGQELAALGCHVIQADELGHAALLPDGEAYAAVVREFGPAILDAGGIIDRRQLAAEVFNNPERLAVLNHLVHPVVFRREEETLAEFARQDPAGIGVIEAAILIETGHYKAFDRIIVVVCTPEQQIERALRRDGLPEEEIRARLSRQMPLSEKRKFADFVIDTSGEKVDTVRQTREVYASLRRIQK
ncbi:MAG TPA: dephospho-CoA kinase [Bryobacteraceae bacterium]|nr:dephospho-CoA kinase [Bryobacteraceae bacterium]